MNCLNLKICVKTVFHPRGAWQTIQLISSFHPLCIHCEPVTESRYFLFESRYSERIQKGQDSRSLGDPKDLESWHTHSAIFRDFHKV